MKPKKITLALQVIQNIEDKYGLAIFRCGLVHMMYTGSNNFTEDNVKLATKAIHKEAELAKQKGDIPIMTADFKIEIVECAAELAKVETWDLLRYIKKYVHVE